jgi:hypothetical protein
VVGKAHMGQDLDCMADVLMGFHQSKLSKLNTEFNSDLVPRNFWASPTMKRELQGKKFQSNQQSASTFSRSGWSVVRSAFLAKGGTLKKRLSPHLHKALTWSNKVSRQTLQIALIHSVTV